MYDVFGIGAVTVDLIGSSSYWPGPGEKVRLNAFDIYDGGLTGTALATVAKLGGKAGIAAKLGKSFWARKAVEALEKEGVDTSNILRTDGCEPVISMVISSQNDLERNVFFSRKGVSYPMPEEIPERDWFRHTRVLMIDHGTGQAGVEAARLAIQHGVEVIIDAERAEPHLEEMLHLCSHIIISGKFAKMYSGMENLEKAIKYFRKFPAQHIVVTLGDAGLVGLSLNGEFTIPAHKVHVKDTTGCGDVFHGAYALAIARGKKCSEAAAFANAAAALSATKLGGRKGIPDPYQLDLFIRENTGERNRHDN